MQKFKLFIKELGNIASNMLVPLLSVICAVLELCHVPTKWITGVKLAEYICFYAGGTATKLLDMANKDESTGNAENTGGDSDND